MQDDDDLPQNVKDEIALMEAMDSANRAGATDGLTLGIKVCPHCTFENTQDASDCEVCGLPLA